MINNNCLRVCVCASVRVRVYSCARVCVSGQLFQTINSGLCDISWVLPWGDWRPNAWKWAKDQKHWFFILLPSEAKKKEKKTKQNSICSIQKPWTPHKSPAATAILLKEQNRKPETTHTILEPLKLFPGMIPKAAAAIGGSCFPIKRAR